MKQILRALNLVLILGCLSSCADRLSKETHQQIDYSTFKEDSTYGYRIFIDGNLMDEKVTKASGEYFSSEKEAMDSAKKQAEHYLH